MKVEIELPERPGFEYTNERRYPKKGEWFLFVDDSVVLAEKDYDNHKHHILIKINEPALPIPKLPNEWVDFNEDHPTGNQLAKGQNEIRDYLKYLTVEINTLKENKDEH